MANVRITDKPELTKDYDKVVLLGSDPADLKDYKITPDGLAQIVSGRVVYDTICTTAAGTQIKDITIEGFTKQVFGTMIWITFTNGNTAAAPQLSINGETAVDLQVQGQPIPPLFIEANKKYKLEYIGNGWNFTNQAQSSDELYDTIYGVATNLDNGDYDVTDIKEVGRYTWTTKVPAGIVIEGRTEEDNKYGSLTVTKVGSGNDRKQLINFGIDNSQFSRTNPGGNNPWGEWKQTVTDDMLGSDVADINKKISDVIDGTTPVTKISDTATKGGNEVATVNQLSDGSVSVISDTAVNVSNSRVAFRSDTYTKQEVDDIVSTVYKYKGSVPTFADLPKDGNKVGDVYNVEDTGLNWAWDGKKWDELGMNIDTSKLVTKSEVMNNNSVMLWDGTGNKAKTMTVPADSKGKVLVYNGQDQEPTFEKYKTAASWTGTMAEFEEAKKETNPESDNYLEDKQIINITDDGQTGNVSSQVREGDYNPVTGNAVYDFILGDNPVSVRCFDFFTRNNRFITFAFTNNKSIKIKKDTFIKLNTDSDSRWFITKEDLILDLTEKITAAANASSYRKGEINGRNFYIYLAPKGAGVDIVISGNSTFPNDINSSYTASNTRKIGQFHTLCAAIPSSQTCKVEASPSSGEVVGGKYLIKPYDVEDDGFYDFYNKNITKVEVGSRYDVITTEHPLAGFEAGDILPESVWCLSFTTYSAPEGSVHDIEKNKPFDIYGQSGTSKNTASEFGATWTDTRPQENHVADMRQVKKELVSSDEFTSLAIGSNVRTNISGSRDPVTTGGHVDTNGARMVSAIGAEDCCGALWQWTREVGPVGGSGWSGYDGQSSFGQTYGGIYGLLCGGDWGAGSYCGPRSRDANGTLSYAADYFGGRGSSWLKIGYRN